MDVSRPLELVAALLESGGHRWALIGGLAMQAYGLSRATQDVDLVVAASLQDVVIESMESRGFETLHVSEGFSNHLHPDRRLGRVDFVYVDAATADKLFAACRSMPGPQGRTLLVPAPEHLVAMKVHAAKNDPSRRFREMADVEHLLHHTDLKPEAVRRYFEAAGLLRWYDDITRCG